MNCWVHTVFFGARVSLVAVQVSPYGLQERPHYNQQAGRMVELANQRAQLSLGRNVLPEDALKIFAYVANVRFLDGCTYSGWFAAERTPNPSNDLLFGALESGDGVVDVAHEIDVLRV